MTAFDPAFKSLGELSRAIDAGTTTPEALLGGLLERIDDLGERARAFISLNRERALEEARTQAGTLRGHALAGLPYGLKDLFDVAGEVTTAGSRVFHDRLASSDSEAVARLRRCGAIALGKLNLHEFAYGATGENAVYGTPVNAYDPSRLAGGSSSGSASAVAFGLLPAALGTDTGGSVRAPAALNGLVGLKPTHGRISTRGVIPYCWSFDHVGTVTRTVEDACLLLSALAGHDPQAPDSPDQPVPDYLEAATGDGGLKGLTVGLPRAFYFEHLEPEIAEAAESAARRLELEGAVLKDVALPDMTHARTVSLTIQMPEALSYHMPFLETRGELYSEEFRAGLALGQCLLAEHYVRAQRMLTRYRQEMEAVFQTADLLLTPAAPCVAPRLGAVSVTAGGRSEPAGNAITRYTGFFNMTGHPAVTLPSGLHSSGLPMGVQLVARPFEEALLLRAATRIEADPAFRLPLPPI